TALSILARTRSTLVKEATLVRDHGVPHAPSLGCTLVEPRSHAFETSTDSLPETVAVGRGQRVEDVGDETRWRVGEHRVHEPVRFPDPLVLAAFVGDVDEGAVLFGPAQPGDRCPAEA